MNRLTVNGLEIAYQRVGEGPPLVFVHGAAGDSRLWQPQLAGLADEFTVVAWDEPGAGRSSDLPADFGLADYAHCLAALIEALDLGPAHVAGLSWGGTVAQELYRHHPELVATLILADTYAGWKGSLPAEEVRARVAGVHQMLAAGREEFDPTLPGLFAGDPPAGFVPLLEMVAADVRPESLGKQLLIMAETDQCDLLPRIAVPTLLIWGERDGRSPLAVARQCEAEIPDTTLVVIPGAGHVSNLERPAEFNSAVREFCRAVRLGGSPTKRGAMVAGEELDFHPGMGMRWEITRSTEDTRGELFEATNWVDAGMPGPPVHVHPVAAESYEVVEGTIEVFKDGRWSTVRAGEKATVPAGAPHSVRNASDAPARIVNVHQPAQRFESFFRDMHRLIHEGKIKRLPPKEPRSAIYAAMLFGKYPDEIRTVKPPNVVFRSLALVGRALRFKV